MAEYSGIESQVRKYPKTPHLPFSPGNLYIYKHNPGLTSETFLFTILKVLVLIKLDQGGGWKVGQYK